MKRCVEYLIKTNSTHIVNGLLSRYITPDPTINFLLTDSYIYVKDRFLIKYDDIVWVYQDISKNSIEHEISGEITIFMVNGSKYTIRMNSPSLINYLDTQGRSLYGRIIDEVSTKNPNALFGFSNENMKEYNKRVQ